MDVFRATFLVFFLNLLDALLTIIWVRNGIAHEANGLMAELLEMGDLPFLSAKLAIGLIFAAVVLYGSEKKLARYGVTLAIAIYLGLIGIHLVTGLSALAFISELNFVQMERFAYSIVAGFVI
ncbi:MAG: DUF5658 family protein [Pyrinomonadaceae bacterium]